MAKESISVQVMVLETDKNKIWVRATACDNCTTCNAGGGCRSRLFTMFSNNDKLFKLDNVAKHSYHPGDLLNLSCPANLPLLIITTMYFVPLIIFAMLTAVGHYVLQLSEVGTILLAACSVLYYVGLYIVKPVFIWQKILNFNMRKI